MTRTLYLSAVMIITMQFAGSKTVLAQTEQQKLTATIIYLDSLFWAAYNECAVEKMIQYFSDDMEFYHDKGGPTYGKTAFTETLKKNLCGDAGFRLRREAITETVKVFPLQNGNEIYGAIISGEHLFYINQKGKIEFLDGHASFMQLWLLKDGAWKMTRILSDDHHTAEPKNK